MSGVTRILLASDVHLREDQPETTDAFHSFLRGPAQTADELYLLGDIFDLWLGDDEDSPLATRFTQEVSALDNSGVAVYFQSGNHDFLLGEDMAKRCGMKLLPDEHVIVCNGKRILLLHGDTLCTNDKPYMEWRAYSHNPENIRRFLELPMEKRREESQRISDVNSQGESLNEKSSVKLVPDDNAVADAMRRHQCELMVHGHMHVQGVYQGAADGKPFTRYILPSWSNGRQGYMQIDRDGPSFVKLV